MNTRGVIYVHAAPAALIPHLEWAMSNVLGARERALEFQWTPQPAMPRHSRVEVAWVGPPGTASRLASELRGWPRVRFEVTEEPSAGHEGERYSYTPGLGIHRAVIGVHGDVMINEERLRGALERAAGGADLRAEMDVLLGAAWDTELEPFRYAGDGAPVRVLHHVV